MSLLATAGTVAPEDHSDLVAEPARLADLAEILRVERLAWPSGEDMQADERKFACRIELGGVVVARCRGRIMGFLSTFRPRWASADSLGELLSDCPAGMLDLPSAQRWDGLRRRYAWPASWHEATRDGTLAGGALHRPEGEVVFGVGITTDPAERGRHVARTLLTTSLRRAGGTGARYFIGYSRLPQYHGFPGLGLDEYVARSVRRPGRAAPYDFGFRLHWSVGAKPARTSGGQARYIGVPGAMRDDRESRGCGVLIVTPLDDLVPYPFERLAPPPGLDAGSLRRAEA